MSLPLGIAAGVTALTDLFTGLSAQSKTTGERRKGKRYLAQATEMMEQDPLLIMLREQFPDLFSQEVWDELLSQQRMGLSAGYQNQFAELASALGGQGMEGSPAAAYAKASLGGQQARDWSRLMLENEMARRQSFTQNAQLLQSLYPLLNPGVAQRMQLAGMGQEWEGTNLSGSLLSGLAAALGGKGLGAGGGISPQTAVGMANYPGLPGGLVGIPPGFLTQPK
jgi:hypothetical protein